MKKLLSLTLAAALFAGCLSPAVNAQASHGFISYDIEDAAQTTANPAIISEITPTPGPTAASSPAPAATPAPTPDAAPSPTPDATPAPTPDATPSPTLAASSTPTPTAVAVQMLRSTYVWPCSVIVASPDVSQGTITVTDENNSPITGTGSVSSGTDITITATPADGYILEGIYVDDTRIGADATVTHTVNTDINVTARFSPGVSTLAMDHEITFPAVPNGALSVTGVVNGVSKTLTSGESVDAGSDLTVTLTPDSGYQIDSLTIGGVEYAGGETQALTKTVSITSATAIQASLSAVAAYLPYAGDVSAPTGVYDDDGDPLEDNGGSVYSIGGIASTGSLTLDGLLPGQTFYIELGNQSDDRITALDCGSHTAAASELAESDLFKISLDKSGAGKSLISSITQVSEKKMSSGSVRGSYLKVVLKDSATTEELKAVADITFKARKSYSAADGDSYDWDSGDEAVLTLTMWINNGQVTGSDGDADTGSSVYFSPDSNELNTFVWGDDRAALEFYADDDADDFYARLSTKTNADIYTEYGDPADAQLYFYDFVGNPTIPSTSRASLTLGIPWDEDDGYAPDPEDCYIYQVDSDGSLRDVTDSFNYSEDDFLIDGWTTQTRVLGSYILSDTALDVDVYTYEADSGEDEDDYGDADLKDDSADDYETMTKVVPVTGGGDYRYLPAAQAEAAAPQTVLTSGEEQKSPESETGTAAQLKADPVSAAGPAEPDSLAAPAQGDEGSSWILWIIAFLLVLGVAAGWYFIRRCRQNKILFEEDR